MAHIFTRFWSFFSCYVLFIDPSSSYGLQRKATKNGNSLCSLVFLDANFNCLPKVSYFCFVCRVSGDCFCIFFLGIITLICSKISFFICSFPNTVSRNYFTLKSEQILINPLTVYTIIFIWYINVHNDLKSVKRIKERLKTVHYITHINEENSYIYNIIHWFALI